MKFQFEDVSNYRGCLEVKEENNIFFWRVDCDVDEHVLLETWQEIPEYLFMALAKFHGEKFFGRVKWIPGDV